MRTKSFILGAILMLFAGLVFVVGVFAASNATVNINGIVNFEAIGNVKATVAFEHTANNNIKVMKNESEVTNANGVLTIVGNESNMTGSFVSETIDLEAPAGAKGDVTYTYTLTITNTYASDAVADKKDLQITFTPPTTTANISSHFQSN